jgi:DNA-directed DNA polymerase III PolC
MYVPLRVHGHHSFMTGVDSPAKLVSRARELGLPGLALTEVDTLASLVEYLQATSATQGSTWSEIEGARFQSIVGAEISDPSGLPGRVIALVESAQGYRNLCKLVSARQLGDDPGRKGAKLEGPEHFDLVGSVARHQEGLILLADHPRLLLALAGRVARENLFAAISPAALRVKSSRASDTSLLPRNAAHAAPRRIRLDEGSFDPRAEESPLEPPKVPPPARAASAADLAEAARAVEAGILAVPDVYAAHASGERDHKLRVAIKHNALLDDLPAEWLAERPLHLLPAAEMRALYADFPGALERTLEVAARCTYAPPLGGIVFPTIALERGETPYSKLCKLAFDGARRRYRPLKPEVLRRLDYELCTIERLGFAPYFLLVMQIADFAKAEGIPCIGRGSAADSLVAYCLELTDADPLRYRLIFERFLNPARRDRPDIDLDFCWRRRDEVLEHVGELFGVERTAMIATLNRCGLRAAFRESALVLGIPPAEVNRWSKRLPYYYSLPRSDFDGSAQSEHGEYEAAPQPAAPSQRQLPPLPAALRENPIAAVLRETPEAEGFPFEDARFQEALLRAAQLVDAPRHLGLHPGGVIVAPESITDHVSCHRAAKGVIAAQFDKDAVEAIGLVKMDLLGNRALTTIDDCLKHLATRGIAVDFAALPEDEPETARTLSEGRTLGCFQIESPGMRNLLQQIGARTMDDVIQAVALIRPGPASSGMKDAYVRRFRKLEAPTPPHPRLTELLWDTFGVMLYQEDVMQAAALVASMELSEADLLRRALTKRRAHELGPLHERFLAGAAEQGIAAADAERVWELVSNFASFGFCKAHAVTYGRISWRAAWLKTHHPAVFLASFLASDTGYYDARVYVEEARRLGVAILPPDVNQSGASFAPEWIGDTAALRIGLGQVKGLSHKTLERLLETRARRGCFVSLPEFLERTGAQKDEAEALIRCGAFAPLDRTIPELLWRLALLSAPARALPRTRPGESDPGLDPALLAACRGTPKKRAQSAVEAARAKTGGWNGKGLALGRLELAGGQSAALFPEPEAPALALPRLPDPDPLERAREEFALLGLTVSAHPLQLFPCAADERLGGLRPKNPIPCGELARFEGARVTLRGWPAATRHVRTADGRSMRFLTLEDESGLAEVVVFPDVYERDGAQLATFGALLVTGTVENQLGARTLHAERIW